MVIIARQWTLCVLRDLVEQQHMWLTFGKHLIRIWSETACIPFPLHASVLHANTWFMCVCVCGRGDSCNCIGAVMEFRSFNTCDDSLGVRFATFRLKFVAIGYFPVSYLLKEPTFFEGVFCHGIHVCGPWSWRNNTTLPGLMHLGLKTGPLCRVFYIKL